MRVIRSAAAAMTIAVMLVGCTATNEPKPVAKPTESGSPTATAEATQSAVDKLPMLEGATVGLPEGWTTGTCDALQFAVPPGWGEGSEAQGPQELGRQITYANTDLYAVPAPDGESGGVAAAFTVVCGQTTKWQGEWTAEEGDVSNRLNVPGAKLAATYSRIADAYAQNGDAVRPGDTILEGQFQMTTPDDVYYAIEYHLPPNDEGKQIASIMAGNLAFK